MSRSGKRHGEVIPRGLYVALCSATLLFVSETQSQAQSTLTHHVRQDVMRSQAQFLRPLPATQSLRLDIVLPLRDRAGLERFVRELSDPSGPSYRNFLTVSEFTSQFGPTEEDYNALTRYAISNGLQVVGGSRDGMDLQIEGPVAAIETAFDVRMSVYQHPTENRTFYAPDREPTVRLPFPLWHISGLDNYSIPQPKFVRRSDYAKAHGLDPETGVSQATTGSGPSASFLGSDMRAAYYGGTALTGAGQNLGLLSYVGTNLADLNTYFKNAGQTNSVPITLLSTDRTSTSCVSPDCDDTEPTLDLTQALGMAPGLASLVMYIGSSDTAILSAMTTHDPLPTTIGCSWGWTPVDPSTLDPYLLKLAAQGQTFFVASGDYSTWKSSGNAQAWPADNAYVVSVGGTVLTTTGAGGPWKSETAWTDSGGGISPDAIPIPSWQQISGVIDSSNKGSTVYRNGPDVSANAGFTFYVCANQTACSANSYGGTSFAAPMWAAYMALINQQAIANGNTRLGFINPTIYSFGTGSGYSTDFHDISSGTSGSYSAVIGYDLVTGWGSPNGSGFIQALAAIPTSPNFLISASPASVSVALGSNGTSTITTAVSGGFDSAIALSATGQPAGVTVSFNPTSVVAPGSGTSTMTITAASNVTAGSYTVTVTGTGGGLIHTASVSLTVNTAANPLQFYPLTSCRVADTRSFANFPAPFGAPSLAGNSSRSFPLPSSTSCSIPPSAVAYSLNITAVPTTSYLGWLTVWPTGQPQPVVSTLNAWNGLITANAAIVLAGTGGAISVYASDATDVFMDIDGYFAPPESAGLDFYPLTPCRIADTRSFANFPAPFGAPPMPGNGTRAFPVLSSSCGVPGTASVYSLNVTAVPDTNYLGWLTVWPTGQPQPVVSTLNAWNGLITANAAVVPAGTGGAISFYASNATDLFFDVNGYFGPRFRRVSNSIRSLRVAWQTPAPGPALAGRLGRLR